MLPLIPNPIHPEWYDYKKYTKKINEIFNNWAAKSAHKTHGVNQNKTRIVFWKFVNKKNVDKDDIYTRMAFHIAYDINSHILLDMKKINPNTHLLQNTWFAYLEEKIFRKFTYEFKYSFLNTLCSHLPLSEEMRGVYQLMHTSEPVELFQMMVDDSCSIIKFFNKFQRDYGAFFNLFEKQSLYLGKHIGKIVNAKLNTLYKVYSLKQHNENPSDRAPVGYQFNINQLILDLIHIKNGAISHGLFNFNPINNPVKVTIWDRNLKGVETFRKSFDKAQLHEILYFLMILSRGIQRAALYFSFIKKIAEINYLSRRTIKCPQCNYETIYVVTPNKKKIKCKKCKLRMSVKS